MAIPAAWRGRLRLPVLSAPMFLISGPDLVVGACNAGVVGCFPALNQRSSEGYGDWLDEILARLAADAAPFGVNLVVHRSNPRLEADLAITVEKKVPLVITSLGLSRDLIEAVHGYGGLVFHDVTNLKFAEKAAAAGVDGLIAVASGAGGHGGSLNPFAAVHEIRRIFDGTLLVAGGISTGRHVAAATMMGADMAYMGTRFMATAESLAVPRQRAMLLEARAADIVLTPAVSGIPGNFLRASLAAAGRDPDDLTPPDKLNFGTTDARAWRDLWAAGQGVGAIDDMPPVAALVETLHRDYVAAFASAEVSRFR
ncbi:nitronate monooxygenase family protein [Aquibium sp. ELW1220]|uniref:NAD(P)H-dependent flavin oxidoreductase n=1 Tax=Aquibium sp. ELW1220 TaxID=2976766 RepID=UPI0025B030FF|nr:nitronate monooxygenase family protein [Aquibium sp. ELW1220]MDN2580968.1 nitronate monooxygenase family protein [Aquibium sp. ELW1220]